MAVSRDDVLRTAALARLTIPDDRLGALVDELNGILAHLDVLARVAAPEGVAPRPPMPLAADDPGPVPLDRPREAFAPAMRDGFFLVPRLSSHDGEGAS